MQRMSTVCVAGLVVLHALSPMLAGADPTGTETLSVLDARIAEAPHDVRLLLARAELYVRANRAYEALADLRLAESLGTAGPALHAHRAAALHQLGRDAQAEAELDAFLASTDGTQWAHDLRGRIREADGRFAGALEDYEAALRIGPRIHLFLARGRVLERLGRLDEAAYGYRDGLSLRSGAVVLREALVRVERARGEWDEALQEVDRLLAASGRQVRWLLLRADVLDAAGRSAAARAARTAALADAERSLAKRPSARNQAAVGLALVALGRHPEAISVLTQALARSPSMEDARDGLAQARRRMAARTEGSR